jgi:hypothetical protein
MTLENDFATPWAVAEGANVETQAEYEADSNLGPGVTAGLAESALYNKSMRQATIFASVLSQFIVNLAAQPVLDNGTSAATATATILADLLTAIQNALQPIIQNNTFCWCTDTGAANAYVVAPAGGGQTMLTPGMMIAFAPLEGNNTTSTLNYNGTGAQPFNANAGPMQGGEITATGLVIASWSGSAWRLIAQANGGNLTTLAGSQSNHAVNFGQMLTALALKAALNGSTAQPFSASTLNSENIASSGPLNLQSNEYTNSINLANSGWVEHYCAPGTVEQAAVTLGQFPSSLGATGHKIYADLNSPSGYFIEQWFLAAFAVGTYTYTFPYAFPNEALAISISPSIPCDSVQAATTISASQYQVQNNYTVNAITSFIRAIGY